MLILFSKFSVVCCEFETSYAWLRAKYTLNLFGFIVSDVLIYPCAVNLLFSMSCLSAPI